MPVLYTFQPSLRLGTHTHIDLSTIRLDAPDVTILRSGACGKVYAVNVDLGHGLRALALKVSQAKNAVDDKQMMVEGVAHARASGHPSVIRLHAYQGPDKPGGPHYLLMDRAQGTLQEFLTEQSKLLKNSPKLAVPHLRLLRSVMSQLLPGLRHLHRCGVTHGDIKPNNLLFYDGRLCIADFGGATVDRAGSDNPICTPFYTPPEGSLSDGPRRASPVWDMWAAAIVARQMVPGGLSINAFRALRQGVCELPRSLSPRLASFLKSMLQHDPRRRPTLRQAICHPLFDGLVWAMPDELFGSKAASLPSSEDSCEVGSLSGISLSASDPELQSSTCSQQGLWSQRQVESECELLQPMSIFSAGVMGVEEPGMGQELCERQGEVDCQLRKLPLCRVPEVDDSVEDVRVCVTVVALDRKGPVDVHL